MATHEEWMTTPCGGLRVDTTNFSIEKDENGDPYLKYVGEGSGVPNMYLKDATVEDDKLYITKKDDSVIEFQGGGGGEPETYVEEITQRKEYLNDKTIKVINNKGAETTFTVPDPQYEMYKYSAVDMSFDRTYNVGWYHDAVKGGRLIKILVYGDKYGDGVIHYPVDGIRNAEDAGYYLGAFINRENNHIIISVLYAGRMNSGTRLYTQDISSEGGAPAEYVKNIRRYNNDYHDKMNNLYVEKQDNINVDIPIYENFPLIWKHDDYFYEIDGTRPYDWYSFLVEKARAGVNITVRDSVDDKMYNLQSYSETELIFTSLDYYNLDQQLWLDILYVTPTPSGWIQTITHKHIQMAGTPTPVQEDNVIDYKYSGSVVYSNTLTRLSSLAHTKKLFDKAYNILTYGNDVEDKTLPYLLVSLPNRSDSGNTHQVPFYLTGKSGLDGGTKSLYFKASFPAQILIYSAYSAIRYLDDNSSKTYSTYMVDATITLTLDSSDIKAGISIDVKDAIAPAKILMKNILRTVTIDGTEIDADAGVLENLGKTSSNFYVDVEVPTCVTQTGILRCKVTKDKDNDVTYLEGWVPNAGKFGYQSEYGLRLCVVHDSRNYCNYALYQLGTRKFMATIDDDLNLTFPQEPLSTIDNYLYLLASYEPSVKYDGSYPVYYDVKFDTPSNNIEIWLFKDDKCCGILKGRYAYSKVGMGARDIVFGGQVWYSYGSDGAKYVRAYATGTSCKLVNLEYRIYNYTQSTGYSHQMVKYVVGQATPV